MEVSFGVLAMWIYSIRYNKFKQANPWDGLIQEFYKPPENLVIHLLEEQGTRERESVKEMGDHVLSSREIKHLLKRAWCLYGLPAYLSGDLDLDTFNDPIRLEGMVAGVEYVIKLFSGIKLPDVHTVEYNTGWNGVQYVVDVTEDSITTKMGPWGWLRSSSSGFEYKITKPEYYLKGDSSLEATEGYIDQVSLIKTHLFICAWIGNLHGEYRVEALDVLALLLDFMKDESRTWVCDNHQWEKK
jgi:hypothetical protein